MSDLAELTTVIEELGRRRERALSRELGPFPKANPTASSLSPCARETTLAILHWQDRPPWDLNVRMRLDRGQAVEEWVKLELGRLGYMLTLERHPFEVRGRNGRVIVRGKVDGFLDVGGSDIPVEIKSLEPNSFRRIHAAEDLDRLGWAARWTNQVQIYLYAHNRECGMLLLDDCLGHWRPMPVTLDYERTERLLHQCEAAVEAVAAIQEAGGGPEAEEAFLPPFHPDPTVCRRCWAFGRVCAPPLAHEGYEVVDDEEILGLLSRREELLMAGVEKAARELDGIWDRLKDWAQGRQVVVGDWLLVSRGSQTHYKAREARDATVFRLSVTKATVPEAGAVGEGGEHG